MLYSSLLKIIIRIVTLYLNHIVQQYLDYYEIEQVYQKQLPVFQCNKPEKDEHFLFSLVTV